MTTPPKEAIRIVADLESERRARNLMQVFAGELGAIYDAIRDEYRYTRDGHKMRLALRKSERTGLMALVYIQELEDVAV